MPTNRSIEREMNVQHHEMVIVTAQSAAIRIPQQEQEPTHASSAVFDENAPEYFPSTCCEFLHIQSALYLASFIQLIFVLTLSLLYLLLEQSQFINAVDVFRPGVGLIVCVNLGGIFCALAGVCLQRNQLISVQITLLLGLVCLSDLLAFVLVATMAFGSRIKVASQLDARQLVQSLLVNENRWESLLGPFWPYLLAILFHMAACSLVCFMSIYRRYGLFLRHKYAVVDSSSTMPSSVRHQQRH